MKEIVTAIAVTIVITAMLVWGIDYHSYHATVTELLTKCGEPCL